MPTTPKPQAAIYARLSKAAGTEESESSKRQVDACRKLAKDRGLSVCEVIVDDDKSAFSGKLRPGYQRLLELIASGEVSTVLAWHSDRLHRSASELESFLKLVLDNGVAVATVQSGTMDASTAAGRFNAGMLSQMAHYESDHRSERVLAAKDSAAAAGIWHGGVPPYGYVKAANGSLKVVPAESKVILGVAKRLAAGERIGVLVEDLNTAGVSTRSGGLWDATSLAYVVVNPAVAGRRIHRGDDVGAGAWKAILSPRLAAAMKAWDGSRSRLKRRPKVALLTAGRIRCASCEASMQSSRTGNSIRGYRCSKCSRSIKAEPVEELVTEALLLRLDEAKLPAPTNHGDGGAAVVQLAELESELTQLATDLGAGLFTRGEWLAMRKPLEQRITDARQAVETQMAAAAKGGLGNPKALRRQWPKLGLEERQRVVDLFVDSVRISKPGFTGNRFDSSRVAVIWKK
jgi:site-specific DNA recombinase